LFSTPLKNSPILKTEAKMNEETQFMNIEIRLPSDLLEVLKSLADMEGKSLNTMIVTLLDQAIFITPQDLAMIKDKALRKADLDQLKVDENIMVDEYTGIIKEIKNAAGLLEKLK
jgi:hypothetical protein